MAKMVKLFIYIFKDSFFQDYHWKTIDQQINIECCWANSSPVLNSFIVINYVVLTIIIT